MISAARWPNAFGRRARVSRRAAEPIRQLSHHLGDMTRMQPVSRSRCETPDDVSLSPCIGEVATNFAAERNAEIKASMAAAAAARDILFAQVRNNEINA